MGITNLVDVPTGERHIGRGVVLYGPEWDGTTDLTASLTHLGDTEGEIVFDPQPSHVYLMTPELRGAGKLLGYEEGKDVVIDMPFFVGSPAMMAILDAVGTSHGGYTRRVPVTKFTIAIIPEELYYHAATKEYDAHIQVLPAGAVTKSISGSGGPFVALTTDEERLFNLSLWIPSGHFIMPQSRFRHEDAGKAVETVRFQGLVNEALPNGYQQFFRGQSITDGDLDVTGIS